MPAIEFQAVVLAFGCDGEGLFPLTDDMPTALLPVANRPLISFQLELLARSGSFSQVLVLTVSRWFDRLSTWVSEQYKGPLGVELLIVPDDAGSADALRHIKAKLTTDFVLLAGDVISDVPFQRMADLHRLQGAAATALFRETPPREAGVAKKAKDLDGIDFVGVDEKGQASGASPTRISDGQPGASPVTAFWVLTGLVSVVGSLVLGCGLYAHVARRRSINSMAVLAMLQNASERMTADLEVASVFSRQRSLGFSWSAPRAGSQVHQLGTPRDSVPASPSQGQLLPA